MKSSCPFCGRYFEELWVHISTQHGTDPNQTALRQFEGNIVQERLQ